MTLLALFDSKQKNLRSELRKHPSPEVATKQLQQCFDDMYNEYSVAQSLDLRGQRELAFVMDTLKQSVAVLLSTSVSSKKEKKSATPTVTDAPVNTPINSATKQLEQITKVTQLSKQLPDQLSQLNKASWANIPTPFGTIKPWTIAKGFIGFFLFAMLWFQSQFFAAFIVLVLGFGDLAIRFFGPSANKKKAMSHSVTVDSAALLSTVAELIKCAEKLLSEKQSVAALANPDVDVPKRLPVLLFQDLMEARYANDGDLALKRILKLPASLEDMGIRAVDYDGYNADYFDILPKIDDASGNQAGYETAVPALLKGDQVLARGRVYL